MKRIYIFLTLVITLVILSSCGQNTAPVKKVIMDYQNSVNKHDYQKLKSLYLEPNSYEVNLGISLIKEMSKEGLDFTYDISVLDIKIYDDIAEAKLKTGVKYSGTNKEAVEAFSLLSTSSLIDSTMTFKKTSSGWKIADENIELF